MNQPCRYIFLAFLFFLFVSGCASVKPVETNNETVTVASVPSSNSEESVQIIPTTPPTDEPTETLTAEQVQILNARRDAAEAMMRKEMTLLWRAQEDITYRYNDAQDPINIRAGRLYQGMPYSHGSGSLYSWLSYATGLDEKGAYIISGITTPLLNYSTQSKYPRISNNCADALFWAWGSVSSSIRFTATKNMTATNGCIKVGDYHSVNTTYEEKDTKDICKENGETIMYNAYARLRKADAVVCLNGTSGHAMMIVSVRMQTKKGESAIDPNESYVIVLEQKATNVRNEVSYYDQTLQEDVYVCGGVNLRYTFKSLYSKGYLPITCKELIDPAPLREESVEDSETNHSVNTIFTGSFTCPYRISSVTVTITDKDGKTVQQITGYSKESEKLTFQLSRLSNKNEASVVRGTIDLEALPAGTYRCVHSCQISTGSVITVRDFEFKIA